MRTRLLLAGVSCAALYAAHAFAGPQLVLHVARWVPEVDDPPCERSAIQGMGCGSVVVEGYREVVQGAFLYLTGVESVSDVSFGFDCSAALHVGRWQACRSGVTLVWPLTFEPSCMSFQTIRWDPPLETGGIDELVLVGYIRATMEGPGTLGIRGDDLTGEVSVFADGALHDLSSDDLGVIDFGAEGAGFNPCAMNTPVASRSWAAIKAIHH